MNVVYLALAGVVGFVAALVAAPLPANNVDCGVHKVDQKTVTSFVLKPPPSPVVKEACPPAEHVVCPVVEQKVEEKPVKRRRHRRYWR